MTGVKRGKRYFMTKVRHIATILAQPWLNDEETGY